MNINEEDIFKILKPQAKEIYFTIKELKFNAQDDIDTLIKKCQHIKNMTIHKKMPYIWLSSQVEMLPSSKKDLPYLVPSVWYINVIIRKLMGRCKKIIDAT